MWVDPRWRGKGIGGELLDAGLAWAASALPGRPVYLEVNPTQTVAIHLYESRGFRPTGVTRPLGHGPRGTVTEMVRSPEGDPDRRPPVGGEDPIRVTIVPLTPEQFDEFLAKAIPRRAERMVRRGVWSEARALEASRAAYAARFPQGWGTPGQSVGAIVDRGSGTQVGEVWYSVTDEGGVTQLCVEWIWIEPEYRRQGFAAETFRRLEEKGRELGVPRLGLIVWADNPGAIALYQKLGYVTSAMSMVKTLAPREPDDPGASKSR